MITRPTGVRAVLQAEWFRRLMACLSLALVMNMVTGATGTQNDYLYAIRQDFTSTGLIIWLLVGLVVWLAFMFLPLIQRSIHKPGAALVLLGLIPLVVSAVLQPWYTPKDYKFFDLAKSVGNTSGISALATAYFGWLLYLLLGAIVVLTLGAFSGRRPLAVAAIAADVVAIVITYLAHHEVVDFGGSPDHSNGWWLLSIALLLFAGGVLANTLSSRESADVAGSVDRVLSWRVGVLPVALGVIALVDALLRESWLFPGRSRYSLSDIHDVTAGSSLAPIATAYFGWLAYVLGALAVIAGIWAMVRRDALVAWVTAAVGLVGLVLTLVSLYEVTDLAAQTPSNGMTGPWQQLDHGGWLACGGFFLFAAGGVVIARQGRRTGTPAVDPSGSSPSGTGWFKTPGSAASVLVLVAGLALFLPQILSVFWQGVAVDQMGIFILLAIGLNVVVGWAGLLDLGFVAFFAIGAYVSAYFAGALPATPPFKLTPFLVMPIAVAVCLGAGLLLGAPTLRLRGDYLAIVTLGFGEIVRIIANNSDGITNGSRGPIPGAIKPFSIHLGPVHIDWASSGLLQASIQYWYLLLAVVILVVIAFRRLEYSRIGRAWAAIREDEIAAQATGVNTVKYKLMAFAIGASTSGLAGVIYASKIGSFTPDNFTLQISILIVAYVVFGGMGSLPGAAAGAAALTWLPQFLKDYVPNEDRFIYIGAVLVMMMIFRPAGLIPARRRALELSGLHPEESETRAVPTGEGLGATS